MRSLACSVASERAPGRREALISSPGGRGLGRDVGLGATSGGGRAGGASDDADGGRHVAVDDVCRGTRVSVEGGGMLRAGWGRGMDAGARSMQGSFKITPYPDARDG